MHKDSYSSIHAVKENWKQPKCPSEGEWWTKLWVQSLKSYGASKENEMELGLLSQKNGYIK